MTFLENRLFVRNCIVVLLLMFVSLAFAQDYKGAVAVPSPAPSSSGVPKFNTSVSKYTGSLQAGLPLMTVSSNNISIPISLNYTMGSGIPVNAIASNVGMGWLLDYGGVITREVRGLPDDLYYLKQQFVDDGDISYRTFTNVGYLYQNLRPKADGRALTNTSLYVEPNNYGDVPALPNSVTQELLDKIYDLEPDVYHFTVGGVSGSFMFDEHGKPQMLTKSDVKIEYTLTSKTTEILTDYNVGNEVNDFRNRFEPEHFKGYIQRFEITLPSGVRFVFSKESVSFNQMDGYKSGQSSISHCSFPKEDEAGYYGQNYGGAYTIAGIPFFQESTVSAAVISWHVTEAYSPISNTPEITWSYRHEYTRDHSQIRQRKIWKNGNPCVSETSTNSVRSFTFGWRPESITARKGMSTTERIVFDYHTGNRQDIHSEQSSFNLAYAPKALRHIFRYIKQGNQSEKRASSVFFNTFYKASTGIGQCQSNWARSHHQRLYLNFIRFSGWNSENTVVRLPMIKFSYNSKNLPYRHSTHQDYWGYYRNTGSNHMIPRIYHYDNESYIDRYGTSFSLWNLYNGMVEFEGVNRHANLEDSKAGILESIEYANGSTTTFDYELNDVTFFKNYNQNFGFVNPVGLTAGGLRVKSIASSLQPIREFEYREDINETMMSSGRLTQLPEFAGRQFLEDLPICSQLQDPKWRFFHYSYNNVDASSNLPSVIYSKVTERIGDFGYNETYFDIRAMAGVINEDCTGTDCVYRMSQFKQTLGGQAPEKKKYYSLPMFPNYALIQGLPTKISQYNQDGFKFEETEFNYSLYNYKKIPGIRVYEGRVLPQADAFIGAQYYTLTIDNRLDDKTTTSFFPDGGEISTKTFYEYGTDHHLPISEYFYNSDGKKHEKSIKRIREIAPVMNIPPPDYTACSDALQDCLYNCDVNDELCETDCYNIEVYCRTQVDLAYQQAINDWYSNLSPLDRVLFELNGQCLGWLPIETTYKINGVIVSGERTNYATNWANCPDCPLVSKKYTYADGTEWILEEETLDYNVYGKPLEVSSQNALNHKIKYFDVTGLVDNIQYGNRIKSYEYDNRLMLKKSTAIDGQEVLYRYDGLGRLIEKKARDENVITTYAYFVGEGANNDENWVEVTTTLSDNANVPKKVIHYDVLGRQIRSKSLGYTYGGQDWVESVSYDNLGRKVSGCTPSSGGCTETIFENNKLKSFVLESGFVGWPKMIKTELGLNAANDVPNYAANTLSKEKITDQNGNISYVFTDKVGKKILTRRVTPTGNADVTYIYDGKDRIDQVIQPNGELFDYGYEWISGTGWKTESTPPGGATYTSQADLLGRTTFDIDANNNKLTYKYNDYNQTVQVLLGTDVIKDFDYYNTDVVAGQFTQLQSSTVAILGGGQIESGYTYDGYGRLEQETTNHHLGTDVVQYQDYDLRDLSATMIRTHTGSNVTKVFREENVYDHGGRLTNHSLNSKEIAKYVYDDHDWMTQKLLGKVSEGEYLEQVGYRYNMRGWLVEINSIPTCQPENPEEPGSHLGYTLDVDRIYRIGFDHDQLCAFQRGDVSMDVETIYGESVFSKEGVIGYGTGYGLPNNRQFFDVRIECDWTKDEIVQNLTTVFMQRLDDCIEDRAAMSQSFMDLLKRWLCEIEIEEEDPNCTLKKGPLFAERIHYVQNEHATNAERLGVAASPQYNGNVSMVEWHAVGMDVVPGYGFTYDAQDQLTNSDYVEYNFYHMQNGYDEYINRGMYNTAYTYDDLAGNIGTIERWSFRPDHVEDVVFGKEKIDELTLTYSGNRLQGVTEAIAGGRGYVGSGGMGYDDRGNITDHGAKNAILEYNYLDRPTSVSNPLGEMTMTYDADGNKTEHVIQGGTDSRRIAYFGGIEYHNGKIYSYATAEGRYMFDAQEGDYIEYNLTDHLGNTRVVFADRDGDGTISRFFEDEEITTVAHYYPFGMQMNTPAPRTIVDPADQTRHRYNGIEHFAQLDLGLDFAFYRTLDPGLGRWLEVDPKGNKMPGYSVYCSMMNNPMTHVDPAGDEPVTTGALMGSMMVSAWMSTVSAMYSAHQNGGSLSLGQVGMYMALGAAQGAGSYGIGEAARAFSPLLNKFQIAAFQGLAHAHAGVITTRVMGGSRDDVSRSALIGFLSSVAGSALGGAPIGVQIAGATAVGGLSSLASGGNFWEGAAQGVIVSGLNHALHSGLSGPQEDPPGFDYNGDGVVSWAEAALSALEIASYGGDLLLGGPTGEGALAAMGLRTIGKGLALQTIKTKRGWISRKIFKSLDPATQKKFIAAMEKGVVGPKGRQGIIKLSATEAKATGYTHKLKILGKGGDIRIYGSQGSNGHFLFDKVLRH